MNPIRFIAVALAAVGAIVVAFGLLDMLGIGHARIYFGADPLVCTVPSESSPGVTL